MEVEAVDSQHAVDVRSVFLQPRRVLHVCSTAVRQRLHVLTISLIDKRSAGDDVPERYGAVTAYTVVLTGQ